ncbi:MAG: response regulator [bacterium]|nr:response regulator [bacterium]
MLHRKKILIVDDEPEITELLTEVLEKAGFTTEVAEDGIKAQTYFKRNLPDLAIVDMLLPGEHGINVVKKIKKDYFIPVIIISGIYKEAELIQLIDDYFVEAFLEKPLDINKLVETVNSILNAKE